MLIVKRKIIIFFEFEKAFFNKKRGMKNYYNSVGDDFALAIRFFLIFYSSLKICFIIM